MKKTPKIKTKDKILSAAIRMFNEVGVQGVTSRHVAAEMGISHGNLDYHFHTKEDLLLSIYDKMSLEASETYSEREPETSSLQHFHRLISGLEESQYRYRFFNMDVLEISRSFPAVSKLVQETFVLRKQQVNQLFEEFQQDGYLAFPDEDISERVQHAVRVMTTFWHSQLEILPSYKFQQRGEMVRLVWTLVMPYLSPAGKEEFQRILASFSR